MSRDDPAASNFPDESFWWAAEANIAGRLNNRAITGLRVLATEAAFSGNDVVNGDQIAFNRVRFRFTGLVPGNRYKVTYPYGAKKFL